MAPATPSRQSSLPTSPGDADALWCGVCLRGASVTPGAPPSSDQAFPSDVRHPPRVPRGGSTACGPQVLPVPHTHLDS